MGSGTLPIALLGTAVLIAAAPAGAATTLESLRDHGGSAGAPRPGVILVYDFQAEPARVPVALPTLEVLMGRPITAGERSEAARRASTGLGRALYEALARRGAPVKRAQTGSPVPGRALLLKGRFLSVDERGRAGGVLPGVGSSVRVRVEFDTYQRRAQLEKLLWRGRVATESSPRETGLLAQGALAEALGAGGPAAGGAPPAAQLLARYASQTAEAIAEALWTRFREAGWLVDAAPGSAGQAKRTSP